MQSSNHSEGQPRKRRASSSHDVDRPMRIFIKNMINTMNIITLDVEASDSIENVKTMIHEVSGYFPESQLLFFKGTKLEDSRNLVSYGIKEDSTLHLVLELRGMISTFKYKDASDPLVRFLMLTDDEREDAAVPLDELRDMAQEENANRFSTFDFRPESRILCLIQCRHLCSFLDFVWTRTAHDAKSDRVDIRLVIDDDTFVQLLSCLDPLVPSTHKARTLVRNLHIEYRKVPGARGKRFGNVASQLALRMTCGPTNACIHFHCDGEYATSTSQIALNCPSEYKGGRLCFFVNDALHILERPLGSITQHAAGVLHGVTALTEGTRKSLFVVDQTNGLGEGGVIQVRSDLVQLFLAHQVSRPNANDINAKRTCVVCYEREADHVMLPCGHMSLFCL
ncbi:hypothetical protein MHU86_1446 [Fragilaria crotonensis]|nr:hypothetical protein MHU86_1446 [Fragilaria crotonensis]